MLRAMGTERKGGRKKKSMPFLRMEDAFSKPKRT